MLAGDLPRNTIRSKRNTEKVGSGNDNASWTTVAFKSLLIVHHLRPPWFPHDQQDLEGKEGQGAVTETRGRVAEGKEEKVLGLEKEVEDEME